ncbi:hypothetical protein F4859DRAFT_520193 [Xylaria cf. heliscus]|nr:hypothetical protein F4859DRAFT_520193 [Xylaria cf. heliscus]
MSNIDHETCVKLAGWYSTIYPRRIDIVGDFGGKQLFLIDGDSLLHHSVTTSAVDYDVGFQLLHAIFAVESFLKSLQVRGCNFHVVFFDNQAELCIPLTAPDSVRYKYQMTRTILIQHLRQSATTASGKDSAGLVFFFPSIDSQLFRQYLAQYPATFLLCHDGHAASLQYTPKQAAFHYMIHQFLQLRRSVALIHGTEFKSSRVIVPMITTALRIRSITLEQDLQPTTSLQSPKETLRFDLTLYEGRSYRELLTAVALCRVLQSECGKEYKTMTFAMILHDAIIGHTQLAERSLAITSSISNSWISSSIDTFLELFCQKVTNIMESDLGESLAKGLNWDIFDIIDGRLFLSLHSFLSKGQCIPSTLIDNAEPLIRCVEEWSGISLMDSLCLRVPANSESEKPQAALMTPSCHSSQAALLPFHHELLNRFLEPIHLQTTELDEKANEGQVFRELTHWHNSKIGLETKGALKKPGFFARKRNQKFMADTLVYSASLTNATGKLIEPKTILVETPTLPSKKGPANHSSKVSITPEAKRKSRKDSGKNSARESALLAQAQKLEKKNSATLQNWRTRAQEFSQEEVLLKRFYKSKKYFSSLKKEEEIVVGAEVSLYLCDTLYSAWEKQVALTSFEQAFGIGSLLFNQILQTSLLPCSTQEVAANLKTLSSAVGIARKESSNQQMTSRRLGFDPRAYVVNNRALSALGTSEFQLGHCGPFLERTFDSRLDDRVPFEPDAWQRSVLDSIDANESLFIVAPTSSGKTFISFYAMEKVLRADNDGVLVYVAPTKALVNQIAAEIQARFHKTYHHEGRSVWAIHTRDYRVNNPTGCQILVTVPHVLQIMLLSPSNANSWSKRVKRIIFDEVHCIGQADDGIIWEQLLLMAPCPIIALSATVGNPEEFCEWLKISQTSKGFTFRMITHNIRYSDLRAFHYVPPQDFEFKGLRRADQFPVPGLDRPGQTISNFEFIHPIATLVNKTVVDLEELSLEPRDALTLWEEMNKFQTKEFPLDDSLRPPQVSSGILKKSDTLAWTQRLKKVLATWIQDDTSPFNQICSSLGPGRKASRNPNSDKEHVGCKSQNAPDQPIQMTKLLSIFLLLCDLHKEDGLPAILFNYDRVECERTLKFVLRQLLLTEEKWKESSKGWQKDIRDYNLWKASRDKRKVQKKSTDKLTKDERMRDEADADVSRWESFDPRRPLEEFSFADNSRLTWSELEDFIDSLKDEYIDPYLFSALERGIAVHHSGMNRRYRQVVEILFRKGFLTAVIATGTLALGINMPCKTVAFVGDSTYLTTLNYRQGAGRAGRRGFDLLGNVVLSNISKMRAYELMSSRLPDLKGHFPLTTTLILRILGLVDAAGQSSFASGIVESLLTQNRLYLGGEEAGKSIQHHLRFSIEYLQRQQLLSADGKPMNFAGLVGHLYFTENAVFAFHSLLKGGYFHRVCSNLHRDTTDTLRKLGLVMAHLFNRVKAPNLDTKAPQEEQDDSGSFSLPRLPAEAEDLLIRHNNETLEIFKTYASTFIDQYLNNVPDKSLPLTGIAVGGDEPRILHLPGDLPPTKLRSPFSALSGHSDDFKSVHELCTNIRSGVFLEESAVPYIPIWPHDVTTPFNSYIYDFLKHGDYIALTRDNKIKEGDVWFLLKDFSLTLATIVASLTNFIRGETSIDDADMIDLENEDEMSDEKRVGETIQTSKDTKHSTAQPKPTKKKVVESWEDWDDEEDDHTSGDIAVSEQVHESSTPVIDSPAWEGDGRGLVDVVEAFTLLKQDFDEKFHKGWA